jgi:hypothetical protein
MESRRTTGAFGAQDWYRFDFNRWHLEGLQLDAPAAMVAHLVEQLFASPEWRQHFTAPLPALKTGVRRYFERRAEELRAQKADFTKDLEARTTATRTQTAVLQDRIRRAAAPPRLTAEPHSFLLGVRVDEQEHLGLPGLIVRLTTPQQNHNILAEGVTDSDGNVVLSLSQQQIEGLAHEQLEPIVEILVPPDKVLHRAERVACPRVNGTETWVAVLCRSPELEFSITVASQARTEREMRLASLTTKIDRLQAAHKAMQDAIQRHLDEAEDIFTRLDKSAISSL